MSGKVYDICVTTTYQDNLMIEYVYYHTDDTPIHHIVHVNAEVLMDAIYEYRDKYGKDTIEISNN